MKRLTATEKWSDPWFRKLSPALKHLWNYVLDNCDNAGVWSPDLELASYMIGMKLPPESAILIEFAGRIQKTKGKWYIPNFVPFQYGALRDANPFHKKTRELLGKHGLEAGRPLAGHYQRDPEATTEVTTEATPQPLGSDSPVPSVGTQEEEEEKEEDKGEGVQGEPFRDPLDIPPPLNTSQPFCAAWQRWMTFRRGLGKKPGDWAAMFYEQLAWLAKFPPDRAVKILEQSIRNGWQGLFEKGTEDAHSGPNKENPRNAGTLASPDDHAQRLAAKIESMQGNRKPVQDGVATEASQAECGPPGGAANG